MATFILDYLVYRYMPQIQFRGQALAVSGLPDARRPRYHDVRGLPHIVLCKTTDRKEIRKYRKNEGRKRQRHVASWSVKSKAASSSEESKACRGPVLHLRRLNFFLPCSAAPLGPVG